MAKVKSFYQFNMGSTVTRERAADKARNLEHHMPRATLEGRYFLWMGWAFDIGRKAYLIEGQEGRIQRVWGRSVDDVRIGLGLSRKVKVVADPFSR